jgi:hypothetical protein
VMNTSNSALSSKLRKPAENNNAALTRARDSEAAVQKHLKDIGQLFATIRTLRIPRPRRPDLGTHFCGPKLRCRSPANLTIN